MSHFFTSMEAAAAAAATGVQRKIDFLALLNGAAAPAAVAPPAAAPEVPS